MEEQFPMNYTLHNGTQVTVTKEGEQTYRFDVQPAEGPAQPFTYRDGAHTKMEWDKMLQFDQLDALRVFWRETDEIF